MGVIGGSLGYALLMWLSPTGETSNVTGAAYENKSKLKALLGEKFFEEIRGLTVIDFGCGPGVEAVEMAASGARRVIGIDIWQSWLEQARKRAVAQGVADRCSFQAAADERAEVIVSLDSFEHFEDPDLILRLMDDCLVDNGKVFVSFGPPWYHPYGGHLFSVFPWAHLLFSEPALLRWRKSFHSKQTAKTFGECGLNKMTIRRFTEIVARSPFRFEHFEARPIRGISLLSTRLTREFATSIVRCTLVKQNAQRRA